ncbi:hypothetical protein TIFTF001_007098 [Ficus carica]|uniref:Uncharacterized protein n=1 Tax=Ficus carica TaxID=3494 RepID=A0AA88ACM7_FICCA|nr:hypothetical protein TIFTF001_007098 [Ficus carica]
MIDSESLLNCRQAFAELVLRLRKLVSHRKECLVGWRLFQVLLDHKRDQLQKKGLFAELVVVFYSLIMSMIDSESLFVVGRNVCLFDPEEISKP